MHIGFHGLTWLVQRFVVGAAVAGVAVGALRVGLFSKLSHFPHLSRQSLSHVQHILLIF
jgi:hypothetical protein